MKKKRKSKDRVIWDASWIIIKPASLKGQTSSKNQNMQNSSRVLRIWEHPEYIEMLHKHKMFRVSWNTPMAELLSDSWDDSFSGWDSMWFHEAGGAIPATGTRRAVGSGSFWIFWRPGPREAPNFVKSPYSLRNPGTLGVSLKVFGAQPLLEGWFPSHHGHGKVDSTAKLHETPMSYGYLKVRKL